MFWLPLSVRNSRLFCSNSCCIFSTEHGQDGNSLTRLFWCCREGDGSKQNGRLGLCMLTSAICNAQTSLSLSSRVVSLVRVTLSIPQAWARWEEFRSAVYSNRFARTRGSEHMTNRIPVRPSRLLQKVLWAEQNSSVLSLHLSPGSQNQAK